MAWTKIDKPTSSVITTVNPQGKETYDQNSLTYDDANTFYDGTNPNQWSTLAKPVSSTWTKVSKPV